MTDAFLRANSLALAVLLAEPTEWRTALPPPYAADVSGTEAHVAVLAALHAAPEPTPEALFCMVVDDAPLYPPLGGKTEADLAVLRGLAEWLQLPKVVSDRLDVQAAANRLRLAPPNPDALVPLMIKCMGCAADMGPPQAMAEEAGMPPPLAARWCAAFRTRFEGGNDTVWFHLGLLGIRTNDGAEDAVRAEWRPCNITGLVAGHHALSEAEYACLLPHAQGHTVIAARAGNLAILERLHAHAGIEMWTAAAAASNGHVHILEWLRAHTDIDSMACLQAARNGHLHTLEWLVGHGCNVNASTCANAAAGAHVPILEWLRERGCPWSEDVSEAAAEHGHFDLLGWLYDRGCPLSVECASHAAYVGRLDVLQWLRKRGCAWSEDVCTKAASAGHLDVLKWARAQGCAWSEWACTMAAAHGHLPVLEWLHANGCPWSHKTCTLAVTHGHQAVLEWLRAGGCPWSADTCTAAAHTGRLATLEWMRAQDPPCPWSREAYRAAKAAGFPLVAQWLRDNGCPA